MKYTPLFVLAASLPLIAEPSLRVVPTFENAGIYIEGAGSVAPGDLRVEYREAGAADWQPGHVLTNSSDNPVPRGSLFGLKEGTGYEVRAQGGGVTAQAKFTTWEEDVPVAKTINLAEVNPGGGPFLIDKSGTADGWVRYIGAPGYVLNGAQLDEEVLLVEGAKFVIIENVTIRGGKRHGIQVRNSSDVRIRNCDIAGFGRVGEQDLKRGGKYYMPGEEKAINWDAGVYLDDSKRVVVEHCYIHDPRNHANSWFYSHPAGPNAVFVKTLGEIVVRYNDFVGSEKHRWNDVIESYGNGKPDGGFNKDSDIYGNFLAFPNDDGIELDGGQCNVRFYGNKVEGGLCGISTAANLVGPSYVINNLVANLGDERGSSGASVKNGGGDTYSKGTTYFYHNVFHTFGRGIAAVGYGSDKNRALFLGVSRNNILATSGGGVVDKYSPPVCDWDYDLFSTPQGGKGVHQIVRPMEAHGLLADAGFVAAAAGDFSLKAGSAGKGSGVAVPGLQAWQGKEVSRGITLGGQERPVMLPLRADLLRADRNQVNLSPSAPEAVVTLTAGPALKEEQAFRVLKNESTDWLAVEPAEGVLKPGQSLTLKTRMTRPKDRDGLLLGAAVVKLANGESLPVTVYGSQGVAPLKLRAEAETLPGVEGFTVEADEAGAKFVKLVDDAAGKEGKGTKFLTMNVEAPADGGYYLYVRLKCPPPVELHDSLFISVNGADPVTCSLTAKEDWFWTGLGGKAAFVTLKKGANAVRLIPREEVWVDSLLLRESQVFPGEALP
jgi:hypothetical protein